MKKNFVIGLLILIIALMITLSCGAAGSISDQVVVVGQNGIYDLNSAVNALRTNAGNAVIYLTGPVNLTQQVEIPANISGLKSVTLASYYNQAVTVSMNGSVICSNGVPVTVEQGVSLSNGFLVGGKCSAASGKVSVDDSLLVINGSVDYVIGGGLAMSYGAVSTVKNVNVVINGSANRVNGGGYAYNGGVADVSGMANILLMKDGTVKSSLYAGGYASGSGSSAPVAAVHVIALGNAAKLVKDAGLADNGGSAQIGSYTIQLANPTAVPTAQPWYGGYGGGSQPYTPPQQTVPYNSGANIVINIGPGQQASDFSAAVNLIPNYAGNVEFRLAGNFRQNNDVVIPQNRGILSVTVTAANNQRATVTWPEDVGFFANGIPLMIGSNVTFSNGIIYGGANVGSGQQSRLQSTYLDISGTVNKVVAGSKAKSAGASASVGNTTLILRGKSNGWLYGGGAALYGGYSVVEGTAALTMTQGSSVEQSVSGGGYAFGAGAESVVMNSNIDISGSVVYAVFLGGYADQSAVSSTNGLSYLVLQPSGNVSQSVWYGGRAYNKASVYLDIASAQISGRVGAYVHSEGGRASDGGTVTTRVIR